MNAPNWYLNDTPTYLNQIFEFGYQTTHADKGKRASTMPHHAQHATRTLTRDGRVLYDAYSSQVELLKLQVRLSCTFNIVMHKKCT